MQKTPFIIYVVWHSPGPVEDVGEAAGDLPAELLTILTVGHPGEPPSGGWVADQQAVEALVPAGVLEPAPAIVLDDQEAQAGDAQTGFYVLRNTTYNASEIELFLDGFSEHLILNSDRTLTFDILVVARSSDDSSAGYQIQGIIENDDGVTQLVGSPTVETLGEQRTAWDVAVEADTINDALVIKVTGEDGYIIRWVATVRTAEVMY